MSEISKIDQNFVVKKIDSETINLQINDNEMYDRYLGVEELMPYAKAVSAKSHSFDSEGYEIHTDYDKMIGIVLAAGYNRYIGIEYEGGGVDEMEGIKLTKNLMEKVR